MHNNECYNKRFPHHSHLSNQQQSQFPNELIFTPHKHDEIKEHDMPFKKTFRKHISRNTHSVIFHLSIEVAKEII